MSGTTMNSIRNLIFVQETATKLSSTQQELQDTKTWLLTILPLATHNAASHMVIWALLFMYAISFLDLIVIKTHTGGLLCVPIQGLDSTILQNIMAMIGTFVDTSNVPSIVNYLSTKIKTIGLILALIILQDSKRTTHQHVR